MVAYQTANLCLIYILIRFEGVRGRKDEREKKDDAGRMKKVL